MNYYDLHKFFLSIRIISIVQLFEVFNCVIDGCGHVKESPLTVFMEQANLFFGFLLLFVKFFSISVKFKQIRGKFLAIHVVYFMIVFIHCLSNRQSHLLLIVLEQLVDSIRYDFLFGEHLYLAFDKVKNEMKPYFQWCSLRAWIHLLPFSSQISLKGSWEAMIKTLI